MESILIITSNGFQTVEAEMYGDYAAHESPNFGLVYSVTHVPTGRAIGHHASQTRIREAAKAFSASGLRVNEVRKLPGNHVKRTAVLRAGQRLADAYKLHGLETQAGQELMSGV